MAYNEYKYLQVDVRRLQMKVDDMCCPSCSGGMYSVHIDGNMKLFTWIRNGQGEQPSYYKDLFFSNDNEVLEHLAMADRALGAERVSTVFLVANSCILSCQVTYSLLCLLIV